MAFCKNCGAQLPEGRQICGSCGTQVQGDAPSGQQQAHNQQGFQQGAERVVQFVQNTAEVTGGIDPVDIQNNKVMGGLAYFLFFLPLIACPDSKYGRFHANQSLMYLITCVGGGIAMSILSLIIGLITWRLLWITSILSVVFWIAVLALGVMGLINGFSGKAKELPVIGKFRIIK